MSKKPMWWRGYQFHCIAGTLNVSDKPLSRVEPPSTQDKAGCVGQDGDKEEEKDCQLCGFPLGGPIALRTT